MNPHPRRRFLLMTIPLLAFVLILVAAPLVAQESSLPGTELASQSLRPYRFVFYAYALAWVMVLGWVVSVARRAMGLAKRLQN